MTTNGTTYYEERQKTNENNLKRWQDWSYSINYVVELFNDVISNLTERLDMAETTIEALTLRINYGDNNYVKLQHSSLTITSSNRQYYSKTCGVFSNINPTTQPTNKNWVSNTVYVYADKTVSGLFINNDAVRNRYISATSTTSGYFEPFTSFSGSDSGTIINIQTKNANKIGGNISLFFSLDSTLGELSAPQNDDFTAKLSLKINYAPVVIKELVTLDKSALSETIVNNTVIPAELKTIEKSGTYIGQYSTTKTAAIMATKKIENGKKVVNLQNTNNLLRAKAKSGITLRK